MLSLTEVLPPDQNAAVVLTLVLSAEKRARSRIRLTAEDGTEVQFVLPRGTVLHDGNLLRATGGTLVRIRAKAEPVLTAHVHDTLTLLRAAYHLGNRHVPVEINEHRIRILPDPVLAGMLEQLGLHVTYEIAPFDPEPGAYGGHGHHVHEHD